ncbi:MAG: hypothetical protein ACI861_001605 [Paracoccaceae bacterium]|jgi:hypothetical protein
MIIKAVSLFLIAIIALAMFGRLKMPKIRGRNKAGKKMDASKCKKCGSYILGKGPCACEKHD